MTEQLWNHGVKKLKPYIPGKSIEDVKKELGLTEIIRMASNENPYGPSPKAIAAAGEALMQTHLYPEPSNRELRGKLGELHKVDPDRILISNGADNVLLIIGQAFVNPGDEVVYCSPTFPVYRTSTVMMGGVPVEVPLTADHKFDLEAMLNHVTPKTKLIYICNPNNPTGTVVDSNQLRSFLQRVPKHVVVVLDEAYAEFISIEQYKSGIDYMNEGFPVISVRTFSKLYGLAAARVGYAIAPAELLQPMLAVREPFPVTRASDAAARAALEDVEYTNFILAENLKGMKFLSAELAKFGYETVESYANFIFVDTKEDVQPLYDGVMKEGFIIRPCTSFGYPHHFRLTIGTHEQNERFIAALHKVKAGKTTTI
ncbi:histidinol-phosphate transaminase [Paenibacillus spongiae]|uniref:Histidinol-phosphate aminotransferase n=1 Tax=Paenibacillus spongiae TaxID=2909671 RepID=A0ABY5SBY8_9BACL|nr:histidinol-phosphate transaminase [Paenibacillus spongiae]UVI31043.1 histidinol-phosphate transaminase [Paenibacillus spongiae]